MTNETYNYSIETFEKMIKLIMPTAIIDKEHGTGEYMISTGLVARNGEVVPLDGEFIK